MRRRVHPSRVLPVLRRHMRGGGGLVSARVDLRDGLGRRCALSTDLLFWPRELRRLGVRPSRWCPSALRRHDPGMSGLWVSHGALLHGARQRHVPRDLPGTCGPRRSVSFGSGMYDEQLFSTRARRQRRVDPGRCRRLLRRGLHALHGRQLSVVRRRRRNQLVSPQLLRQSMHGSGGLGVRHREVLEGPAAVPEALRQRRGLPIGMVLR
jgi:hypothetical protein